MLSARRAACELLKARILGGVLMTQTPQFEKNFTQQEEEVCNHRDLHQVNAGFGTKRWIANVYGGSSQVMHSKKWHRGFAGIAAKATRDSRYSKLEEKDVQKFKDIVGKRGVVVDKDELAVANIDWMHKYHGESQLLLKPQTTQQVSDILQYCNSRSLAVVPQGGNTGLVGGGVPVFDEVILNLGAMNNVISFDEVSGILVCEAGCILENLDNFVGSQGYTMPLDLGAKGSCQIGGNVSTNARGLRLLRYGSLHGTVLGLEVVLADGMVVDMLGTLRKDNTGYDLKQMFIGGEGTLGVVTKVSILVPAKLNSVNVAFLACEDFISCQRALKEAKLQLGEILSAFEFIDRPALDMALNHLSGTRDPLPSSPQNFYLLVETTGSNQSHDKEKVDAFLEATMEKGIVVDGVVAQDNSQAASFWQIREGISEALGKAGVTYKYDFSLPITDFYRIAEDLRARLGHVAATVVAYGHLGDGNVHLNVSAPKYDDELLGKIEPYVFEWVASHKGSVSAEHGLGFMKPHALHYSKATEAMELMRRFKNLMDPKGILNPYKVLPTASDAVRVSAEVVTAQAAEIL